MPYQEARIMMQEGWNGSNPESEDETPGRTVQGSDTVQKLVVEFNYYGGILSSNRTCKEVEQKETEGTKRCQELKKEKKDWRLQLRASRDGRGCTTTRGAVSDKIDLQIKMDRLLAFLR